MLGFCSEEMAILFELVDRRKDCILQYIEFAIGRIGSAPFG
jgi:hypothetical protein